MNVADIVQSVKRQFGDETGAQIDTPDILRWINEGQLRILRKTEGLYTSATISVVASTISYSIPADFFKAAAVTLDLKRLQSLSVGQIRTLYPNLSTDPTGLPKFFAIHDGNIMLAPRPTNAGSLVLEYVNRPLLVTTVDAESEDYVDLTIDVSFHPTLITYCLAQAKHLDGDVGVAQAYMTQFNSELGEDMHDARHTDEETYPFIRTSSGDYCG